GGRAGQGDPPELASALRDRADVRPRDGPPGGPRRGGGIDRRADGGDVAVPPRGDGHGRSPARRLPRARRDRRARQRPLRSRRAGPRSSQRDRRPAARRGRQAPGADAGPGEPRGRVRRPRARGGDVGRGGEAVVKALAASIEEVFREAAARWTLVAYFT